MISDCNQDLGGVCLVTILRAVARDSASSGPPQCPSGCVLLLVADSESAETSAFLHVAALSAQSTLGTVFDDFC